MDEKTEALAVSFDAHVCNDEDQCAALHLYSGVRDVHLALLQVSHSVVQSARRFRAYVLSSGQATSTFSV